MWGDRPEAAMAEGGNGVDHNWSMWLRLLSHSVRDTAGSESADDTSVLQAVRVLFFLRAHCCVWSLFLRRVRMRV